MKKLYSLLFALLVVASATAQSDELAYANIWYTIKANPQGGGKVYAGEGDKTYESILNLQWKDVIDYRQTVSTSDMYGVNIAYITLYAKADEANGYTFAGWYLDTDGDGQLDIQKDELLADAESKQFYYLFSVEEEQYTFTSEAEAAIGAKPSAPQGTVFAHFTRGASVSVCYRQDADHSNCGSVFIDKPANEPGDQVTVRALPEDGYQFEYWQDALQLGNVISRDQTYTFTVQGGERLYAYFTAIDAPVVEFPAEGGFKALTFDKPWVMHDESFKNGSYVLPIFPEDLVINDEGRTYFNSENTAVHDNVTMQTYEVSQYQKPEICQATLVYGKGTVRFAFPETLGFNGGSIQLWSGKNGWTYDFGDGNPYYVYGFNEALGAFVEIGNTDQFKDPYAPTKVTIPANTCYVVFGAFDLTDDEGNIPSIIALSRDGFDRAVSGIEGVRIDERTIKGRKVYTLSGVQVQDASRGIFIVNGKKVILK